MNLRCPYCGAEWSREQEESARAPVCPQCRAVVTVSEDVAPDVDDVPSARCRHCGEPLAPGAVLCTSCGTHCRTGVNVKALQAAGIQLYGGVTGSADQAVADLLAGKLVFLPDVLCTHHGEGHGEGHSCGEHGCGGHSCGSHGA